MASRIQNAVQPDVTTGVQHLFKAVYAGGVPQQTLELVHLRASQVNGCSACVDAGVKSAAKAGVSPEKLLTVAAWYENPLFDDAERAALALAEAATRLSDRRAARGSPTGSNGAAAALICLMCRGGRESPVPAPMLASAWRP